MEAVRKHNTVRGYERELAVHRLLKGFNKTPMPDELEGQKPRVHGISCPWDPYQTGAVAWYFINLFLTAFVIVDSWSDELWFYVMSGLAVFAAANTCLWVTLGMRSDPTDRTIYYQRYYKEVEKDLGKVSEMARQLESFCKVCNMMRWDHSHHCGSCNRCCYKFEHHCVWLNNCIGVNNYWLFIADTFCMLFMGAVDFTLFLLVILKQEPEYEGYKFVFMVIGMLFHAIVVFCMINIFRWHIYFSYLGITTYTAIKFDTYR